MKSRRTVAIAASALLATAIAVSTAGIATAAPTHEGVAFGRTAPTARQNTSSNGAVLGIYPIDKSGRQNIGGWGRAGVGITIRQYQPDGQLVQTVRTTTNSTGYWEIVPQESVNLGDTLHLEIDGDSPTSAANYVVGSARTVTGLTWQHRSDGAPDYTLIDGESLSVAQSYTNSGGWGGLMLAPQSTTNDTYTLRSQQDSVLIWAPEGGGFKVMNLGSTVLNVINNRTGLIEFSLPVSVSRSDKWHPKH
jgi:hypothetical protein